MKILMLKVKAGSLKLEQKRSNSLISQFIIVHMSAIKQPNLAFFSPHILRGNEWLGLTFGPKIFWRSGLMTVTDSWALMALFFPLCDLCPRFCWPFEVLWLGFSGLSQNSTMDSHRVGRWGRQVWSLLLFSPSLDSVRLPWQDELISGKAKLIFSPLPLTPYKKPRYIDCDSVRDITPWHWS